MKPIEEFKTQEELNECLKWWQRRLFLDSWIIIAEVVDKISVIDGDSADGVRGYNTYVFESEQSDIQILSKDKSAGIDRYCAEKVLVHELLHLKYNWMECAGSYEAAYLCAMEHKLLEQMAKTLIMAKYNLELDYFKSGNAKSEETTFGDLTPDWAKSSKLDIGSAESLNGLLQVLDENGDSVFDTRIFLGENHENTSEETYFENRRKACAERRKKMSDRECFED